MDIFEKIGGLAKRRGFIYPGSEIYGGLAGTWDYGPLGVELKRNLKEQFWKSMAQEHENVVGLDAAIMMNPKVWEASGHLDAFSDPLVECKKCHKRFRLDEIANKKSEAPNPKQIRNPKSKIQNKEGETHCPECKGELTEPKQFNLMVEAFLGVIEGEKQKVYLRGEITQGVHVNFKQVLNSTRVKIPFGIAQIGKAFRNEITPGGLTYRSREFEQMELQFYIAPKDEEGNKWMEYWKAKRKEWYVMLGMKEESIRFREHAPDERAHYAREAYDIEYHIPDVNGSDKLTTSDSAELTTNWKEMEGIHHRGDWDLSRHQKFSTKDLTYFDEETKERFIPWVIETSGGVDRAALFFLMEAYTEEKISNDKLQISKEEGKEETRIVLKLHPKLAPYKVAVFPLLANKSELVEKAQSIHDMLKKLWMVTFDARGNIGKRYRSQDEIGTPFCVTVDFDTLEDDSVTVRDRDTMKQERVKINDLGDYLKNKLNS